MVQIRLLLILTTTLSTFSLYSQSAYLITNTGEKKIGYLKQVTNEYNGQYELEYWDSYKDENPERFSYDSLSEFLIKKDTIKMLRSFFPFKREDQFVEQTMAKVLNRGKVNLYLVKNIDLVKETGVFRDAHGVMYSREMTKSKDALVLEKGGEIFGVEREYYKDDVMQLIKDNQLIADKLINMGKYKLKDLIALIKEYNRL